MTKPQDLALFAETMLPAVRRASIIARLCEGRVQNSPKEGEETAVKQAMTVADAAAQEALLEPLLEHFPQVSMAAEEDTPTVARFPRDSDATVIIDPIDGTLHSYLEGGGPYAVMLGLAVRGEYQASLVALPREGLVFHASVGSGAFMTRAGGSPRKARLAASGNRILVSHGMPEGVSAYLREQGCEVVSACGGAVSVAPLIPGVRAGVRRATADSGVSIRGRIGVLIAREAGACVRGQGGADFPRDMETPAPILRVGSDEEDLDLLDRALAAGL